MVAPLVAGAARVGAAGAKAGARAGARAGSRAAARGARHARSRAIRRRPNGGEVNEEEAQRHRLVRRRSEFGQKVLSQVPLAGKYLARTRRRRRKRRAAWRSGIIAWSLIWFYPAQLFSSLMFIIAIGAARRVEAWGILDWFFGETARSFAMFAWMLTGALGTMFMIYAAMMLMVFRVRVWNSWMSVLGFGLCCALYFSPYIFIFPWVLVWLLIVYISQ